MNIKIKNLKDKIKNTLIAMLAILSTLVFADESNLSKTSKEKNIITKIKTDSLSLENGDEILDFIKIYTVKDYIDGDFKNNIFSYNLEKYKNTKRKDKKSSVYNVEIVKTDPVDEYKTPLKIEISDKVIENDSYNDDFYNDETYADDSYNDDLYANEPYNDETYIDEPNNDETYNEKIKKENEINKTDNFIKFDGGYINITKKKESLYNITELKKTINKNYEISNNYGKISENGSTVLDVNKLVDYYFMNKIVVDMNINQSLSEKTTEIILKNKLDFIYSNESITVNLCLKDEDEDENENEEYTKINIGNEAYYLLLNESCYGTAYLKTEKLIMSLKKDVVLEDDQSVFKFNFGKNYNIINFNLKNDNGVFLKIGKYFTKKNSKMFISKSEKDEKYIYIKTKEDNVKINFARFLIKKNCLIYNVNQTRIELCNFKNSQEVNDLTNILKIF
jgi:hypothetical protein